MMKVKTGVVQLSRTELLGYVNIFKILNTEFSFDKISENYENK